MINLQSLYTIITVNRKEIERVNGVEFKEIYWTGLIVWGETVKGYTVSINMVNNTFNCTCNSFHYSKNKKACKHIKKLFMECWKK